MTETPKIKPGERQDSEVMEILNETAQKPAPPEEGDRILDDKNIAEAVEENINKKGKTWDRKSKKKK